MRFAFSLLFLNHRVVSNGRLCGGMGIEGKRGANFWF